MTTPPSEVIAADQYRRAQATIAATLAQDLARLMRGMFNTEDPGSSWSALRSAVAALVFDRRRVSADLAVRYYLQSRLAAGFGRSQATSPAVRLVEDRLTANINATGMGVYQRALRAGVPPPNALDRSIVTLTGAASKLVLEGGRSMVDQTVRDDKDAIGWARIGDGDPCSWCAMLISRGAVYKSADTAGRAKNKQFIGGAAFAWHDHDGCVAVPVWDEDDPILDRSDDLYEQWLRETQGHSGKAAINAWRQYWEGRDTREQAPSG